MASDACAFFETEGSWAVDGKASRDDCDVVWETPPPLPLPPPVRPKRRRKPPITRTAAAAASIPSLSTVRMGDKLIVENAVDTRIRLIAEGLMTHSQTPSCTSCTSATVDTITTNGEYVCTGCGKVLGRAVYDDRPLAIHDDDPEDEKGRVHAAYAPATERYVTDAHTGQLAIVSEVDLSTRTSRDGGRTGIGGSMGRAAAVARNIVRVRAKRTVDTKTPSTAPCVAQSITDATQVHIDDILNSLGIFTNDPLRTTCHDWAIRFIRIRAATESITSMRLTERLAVAIVIRACFKHCMGYRIEDIIVCTKAEGASVVHVTQMITTLAMVLGLPPIDKGEALAAFANRYSSIYALAHHERARVNAMVWWIRWLFYILAFIPSPSDTGMPYVHNAPEIAGTVGFQLNGHRMSRKRKAVAIDPITGRGRRPRRQGKYRWVEQLTDSIISSDMHAWAHHVDFWHRRMKPWMRAAIRKGEDNEMIRVVVAKPCQAWPITRCAPSTIAATLVWMVSQLRDPRPRTTVAFQRKMDPLLPCDDEDAAAVVAPPAAATTTIDRKSKKRRVLSGSAVAAAAVVGKPVKLTQSEIRVHTHVTAPPINDMKNIIHAMWQLTW